MILCVVGAMEFCFLLLYCNYLEGVNALLGASLLQVLVLPRLQKPVRVQTRLFVAISHRMENCLPLEAMIKRRGCQHRSNL